MKKIASVVFALALVFCLLPSSALAAGSLPQPDSYGYGALPQPDSYIGYDPYADSGWSQSDNSLTDAYPISASVPAPVISMQPIDIVGAMGNVPASLSVGASVANGGSLRYQWYAAGLNGGALTAIPGACGASYTPAQTAGTSYYCVGVYNVIGNVRSAEVQSNVAAVNYSGIELLSAPAKTSYTVGERVSLSGLVVRVYDANGGFWDSYDGNGLSLYPSKLESAGTVPVSLSYGMSNAIFYVTVSAGGAQKDAANGADGDAPKADDPNHVHDYGEWEITKEANCINTGIQTRSCACGDTKTEVIPKTDHTWDEGVVTKQPTATTNGSRLYTCTVCKANKSEIIPAGTNTSAAQGVPGAAQGAPSAGGEGLGVGTPAPAAAPAGTVGGSEVGAGGLDGTTGNGIVKKSTDSTGWWLIPVSALILVVCGTGAYYLMKKKGGE